MDAEVRRANGARRGVSHARRIVVDVTREDLPNLDLLDLPGLVAGTRPNEPDDLAAQTLALVEANLERLGDTALYALCHPAPALPFNGCLGLRCIQGKPGREQRAFGILTMADKV